MFWSLNKKNIIEWMEGKERESARGENRNHQMRYEQWLKRYAVIGLISKCGHNQIFVDPHESRTKQNKI
jgi:hypothetical protein